MRKLMTVTVAIALLGGCSLGPDYQAQTLDLPDAWPEHDLLEGAAQGQALLDWQAWWTRFDDPVLNQLVERALDDNLTLRAQVQRIEQARAQLGLARANRWPSLSGQADASREQQPEALMPPGLGGGEARNQFVVAGALSYELDLWGRLARERESASAQLEQSAFGAQAVRLSLIADVVTAYFNLRAVEQQYALARDARISRERTLEIERARYDSGASNPLAIRQAEAQLEGVRAQLPALRQQAAMSRNTLAMLVGYSSAELLGELDFGETRLTDIRLPDSVPAIMPSALLRRRPDVRAAEAGLIAANAQIGVAEASRWPNLNLTGMVGSAALDTSDLFTAPAQTWSLGANLAAPLFDFGRTRARVEAAKAGYEVAQTEYQLAVTGAFRDARDALTLYDSAEERISAIRRQVEAVEQTLVLAELQYERGAIGFYELLDAQRALLDAEMALSEALSDRLAATATLFKAMGGGWQPDAMAL
ncbi:efflux transporter outer membrane subunit [Marinimicrobium alkaliphilum]|uniref:efflux transporter outer membrane subunit n=1 Tax=Marinimicrobium alkaliphilum TaxID=2202654 RepID=UPI000DBA591E|nr:efflux transporter outer membrane subunit [Marinimicrobium alkaliphilum]